MSSINITERAKRVVQLEAEALLRLPIDDNIEKAVLLIASCKGKVFTTGIGKAGYIARKSASTFSTTGSPAVFLHPGDALHGDVGVITPGDILIAFSNSGKTEEIIKTVHFCKKLGVSAVVTITSAETSPLHDLSDIVINIGKIEEACPLGMTPSTSTTAMIAISDALALVTMEYKGIKVEDFAVRHHGGYLGTVTREILANSK